MDIEKYKQRIGQNIAYLRQQHSLTQVDLAAELGFTVNYISLLENGHRGIGLESLVKCASIFNVPPGSLMDWEYNPDRPQTKKH